MVLRFLPRNKKTELQKYGILNKTIFIPENKNIKKAGFINQKGICYSQTIEKQPTSYKIYKYKSLFKCKNAFQRKWLRWGISPVGFLNMATFVVQIVLKK